MVPYYYLSYTPNKPHNINVDLYKLIVNDFCEPTNADTD